MKSLDLVQSSNTLASELSASGKRRLCVANALIGKPRLVVLDEPAAGIDPLTRRYIWKTLRSNAEGRTIVMSSHFLDEVDILCKRKVIITKGTVRCRGTSEFLKRLFGIGYHLT